MLLVATLCSLLVGSCLGAAASAAAGGMGSMPGMNPTDGSMPGMMPGDKKVMCCLPKQWEANMADLKKSMSLQSAHDDATKREGFYIISIADGKVMAQVFKDYVDKKTYYVNMSSSNPADYKCSQSQNNDHFFASCVDHTTDNMNAVTNLKYIGDSRIGSETKGITYDGWSFTLENKVDIILGLSQDNCTPIMESVKSVAGSATMIDSVYMFNNFMPMVKTKELLTIPAACASSASAIVG